MSAKWSDFLTPTGIVALWGAVLSTITAIWNIRRDYLQKRETRRTAKQSERRERLRSRPILVPIGGSSSWDEHTFTFKNTGAPITKLRLLSDKTGVRVHPDQHIGSGDRGHIRFDSKPDLPMIVRLEYFDGMGDKDVMMIELRERNTFEVLGFTSDAG
jgi:hypothetical protein